MWLKKRQNILDRKAAGGEEDKSGIEKAVKRRIAVNFRNVTETPRTNYHMDSRS